MGTALRAIHPGGGGGLCFGLRACPNRPQVFSSCARSPHASLFSATFLDHSLVGFPFSSSCHSSPSACHARQTWLSSEPPSMVLGMLKMRGARAHGRKLVTRASKWTSQLSPYQTLELERDANEEMIKAAYRRLAKYYHPDVYDGRGTLEEGETADARFIKIQAAYELLIDVEKKQEYDREHRLNPAKASKAWMEWFMKKRKAFDQRGDMAIAAWAEQQDRERFLRARNLSRSKVDPEEERRILAKEKKASMENVSNIIRRHTLVLKKRDLNRRKSEGEKKKTIMQLLAAEGLELDLSDDDNIDDDECK